MAVFKLQLKSDIETNSIDETSAFDDNSSLLALMPLQLPNPVCLTQMQTATLWRAKELQILITLLSNPVVVCT